MAFEQSYVCFSLLYVGKLHLEDGNRIIMPQSAFIRLADMEIEYPMLFEIKTCNSDRRVSHCGVLEFTAEDGFVFLPNWLMRNLKVQDGERVVLKNVTLPKGSYMKIQPHKTKFITLPGDPKEILERALKNFACVTAGDTIMITHEYNEYYIDVVETKPSNGISLVETDCEVDFAPPLDYKEPVKAPTPKPKAKGQPAGKAQKASSPIEEKPKFEAFTGVARRVDGQPVVSEPFSVVEETAGADHSGKQSLPRKRPAGKLMFGGDQPNNLKKETKEEIKEKESKAEEENEKKFQPFTGKKYTLADSVVNGKRKNLLSSDSPAKRFRQA